MPNLITQTKPGELFVLRNAGNIIPPYGAANGGESPTIEYAVAVLNVQHIIVCGHSGCGAMQALLDPKSVDHLPAISSWLDQAESTRRIVRENYSKLSGAARMNVAVQENVLVQLENIETHPSVRARHGRGDLTLHAWVYKIETGQVFAFSQETERFMPLTKTSGPSDPTANRANVAARNGRKPARAKRRAV